MSIDIRTPVRGTATAGLLATAFAMTVSPGEAVAQDAAAPAEPPRIAGITSTDQRLNVVAGRSVFVAGRVHPAVAGRTVALQRRTPGGWRTVDTARTRVDGRFTIRLRPGTPGSSRVRLRVLSPIASERVRASLGRLNVYRRANVSWYGPGLYGNLLGCGGRLTPGTLGVAHKTLPCGTRLTLRHRGRVVRVRVIDRGPYVGGREYDLTAATRARLGFSGVGAILTTR
jgi:rare lipoprotein A